MTSKNIGVNPFLKGMVLSVVLSFCGSAMAQVTERVVIPSKKDITNFSNTTFCIAFMAEEQVWALRDIKIAELNDIDETVFNPTGSSLAVRQGKKEITIYSFHERNKKMFELKEKRKGLKDRENLPFTLTGEKGEKLMKAASKGDIISLAMCYAPDARHFIVSNSLGEIIIYDTKEYIPQAYIQSDVASTLLTMSSNNYFIAAAAEKKLDIWNFPTKALRKSIMMSGKITGFDFSTDAAYLAVTTDDQRLTVFDTRTWEEFTKFNYEGNEIASPSFHPEGKYVSVVVDKKNIVIHNLRNGKIEQTLTAPDNVSKSTFMIDKQKSDIFMLSKFVQFLNAEAAMPVAAPARPARVMPVPAFSMASLAASSYSMGAPAAPAAQWL